MSNIDMICLFESSECGEREKHSSQCGEKEKHSQEMKITHHAQNGGARKGRDILYMGFIRFMDWKEWLPKWLYSGVKYD